MSSRSALAAAARIEDEVVYGYGVVGAHLGGKLQRVAASRLAAHQALRDRLRAVGGTGSAAAPAYELAVPVVDAATALALAIRLEDAAGAAAYALVVASGAGGAARRLAVFMLTDVATAAARWRRISAAADGPAFPGQPVAAASASQPSITPTTSPSSSTAASGSTS